MQKEKKEEKSQEKVVKEKRKIDDTDRHKPYGLTAWAPLDDVYMVRYYPKPVYEIPVAIEMLKNFQKLDFTPENQAVYINLCLDMKLEKKVLFGLSELFECECSNCSNSKLIIIIVIIISLNTFKNCCD